MDELEKRRKVKISPEKFALFLMILVSNLAIFLLVGSLVIYHFSFPAPDRPMLFAQVKPTPPPPKPPARGGESSQNLLDPTPQIAPPNVSISSIISDKSAIPSFLSKSLTMSVSSVTSIMPPSGVGLGKGTFGGGDPHPNPFGSPLEKGGTPALVGYFYDLKQTNDDPPKPSNITQDDWKSVMIKLVNQKLDENLLSTKYFRSPETRNTNGFAIPEQDSENAPAAFNLDNVQPNLWAIIWHGKAQSPVSGTFRFVGFGDDALVVQMDGEYVLDAGWQTFLPQLHTDADDTYPYVWSNLAGANGLLHKGKWFTVNAGQTVDFNILIGDWGGETGFFLYLEQQDVNYSKASDGITPKLPLFQIGAKLPTPSGEETPPSSDASIIWNSVNY